MASSSKDYKDYHWCVVPMCTNTGKSTPQKLFISVPKEEKMRKKWLQLARRNPNELSSKSSIYFCEDHFNLPNDMENYMEHKLVGVKKIMMKKNCVPTRFECQPDRTKRTASAAIRPGFVKKQRLDLVKEAEQTLRQNVTAHIRQERPLHLRSELVHPAFRERGRAIPQPQVTSSRTTTRVVEGRPGPLPGMRPTLGGAGHVVPPPKQAAGSMGLIMPIYTIGIVIFFTYTVLKIVFKKQPEALYPPVEPDPNFRREVFESERNQVAPKLTREGVSSKLGDAELDQLRQRLRETELAMERIVEQMAKVPLKLQNVVANGGLKQEEEQPSVKVLGMEMTASCEGGKKWSRPESPVLPSSTIPQEPVEPPQEIFLEGALPAQSHLLVADSATEAEKSSSEEDPAVVLAGKMTLSVISLDSSENGTDEGSNLEKKQDTSGSNTSDDFEKIDGNQINNISDSKDPVQQIENIQLLKQIQKEMEEIDDINITKSESENQGFEPVNQTEIDVKQQGDQQCDLNISSEPDIVDYTSIESNSVKSDINEPSTEMITIEDNKEQSSEIRNETVGIIEENQESSTPNKIETQDSIQETQQNLGNVEQVLRLTEGINTSEQLPQVKETEDRTEHVSEVITPSNVSELLLSNNSELGKTSDPLSSNSASELLTSSESVESSDTLTNVKLQEPHGDIGQVNDGKHVKDGSSEIKSILEHDTNAIEDAKDVKDDGSEIKSILEHDTAAIDDEAKYFEKPNEAIVPDSSADQSRSIGKEEPTERLDEELDNDDDEDEEEIEYEYEDSDNEVVDEEIRNINRLDDTGVGAPGAVNGENQDISKYGTTSSATLAENDISDEEVIESENEDDEVEEIIEYVTDDEEGEEIDNVQPGQPNNRNHLPEQPSLQ